MLPLIARPSPSAGHPLLSTAPHPPALQHPSSTLPTQVPQQPYFLQQFQDAQQQQSRQQQQQQEYLTLPALAAVPNITTTNTSNGGNRGFGATNAAAHLDNTLPNDLQGEPTIIPKELYFRNLKDTTSRMARYMELDSAVRAVFSRDKTSDKDLGTTAAEDVAAARMTAASGFGPGKEDLKLCRAKDIAMTKIHINRTKLFDSVYTSPELNAYLDRAMNYIDRFLRLLDLEEWKRKRMGESKLPGAMFKTLDTTPEVRAEKERSLRELGLRYSLLLVRVSKERNPDVECACFEAIYKLTNVVARIYFPTKCRWDAIGEELDLLFRGAHFHHRPDEIHTITSWKSRAGAPLMSLPAFMSAAGTRQQVEQGRQAETLILPSVAAAATKNLVASNTPAAVTPQNTSQKPSTPVTKTAQAPSSDTAGPATATDAAKEGEDESGDDAVSARLGESDAQSAHSVAESLTAPTPLRRPSVPLSIYKSIHSRSLFTEQIVPSPTECARLFSLNAQKQVLKAHHDKRIRAGRSNSTSIAPRMKLR